MSGGTQAQAAFWRGRRVVVTGHMGFKGAWLTALLDGLGASTFGWGFDKREPLLYRSLAFERHSGIEADVLDTAGLAQLLESQAIDTVFHLAAQPSVRESYHEPMQTFAANVMGTASVLQAVRGAPSVEVVVCVTSDKVYENRDRERAYRETDPLGGHDPYSASKAAAEIVARSMARSFFGEGGHRARVVTVRAGNVIGGGDWCKDRIIPDAARAFARGDTLKVRNPNATRPWQHVLDPLWGYMELIRFLQPLREAPYPAWNFGPEPIFAPVSDVVERFAAAWGEGCRWAVEGDGLKLHEAARLSVDSGLARRVLGWRPAWGLGPAVERTARWYRDHDADPASAGALVRRDIADFLGQTASAQSSRDRDGAKRSSQNAKVEVSAQ